MAAPAPLDELATRMNQYHWAEGEEARRRYVTAIFLRLYPATGEIEVVNAGHNPGFLVTPGAEPVFFNAGGTPLGLLPGMRYSSEKCGFTQGSRLLFYTDGLTESSGAMKSLVRNGSWMSFRNAGPGKPMLSSMHCGQPSRSSVKAAHKRMI